MSRENNVKIAEWLGWTRETVLDPRTDIWWDRWRDAAGKRVQFPDFTDEALPLLQVIIDLGYQLVIEGDVFNGWSVKVWRESETSEIVAKSDHLPILGVAITEALLELIEGEK